MGVIFGGSNGGIFRPKYSNYLGPFGSSSGGKQDVPDTDVGDIMGVNRSKVGSLLGPNGSFRVKLVPIIYMICSKSCVHVP
jgi:hypothetical protein